MKYDSGVIYELSTNLLSLEQLLISHALNLHETVISFTEEQCHNAMN